jgi:hypothetical protein
VTRKTLALVLATVGLGLWAVGLVIAASGSVVPGVVLMVLAGLFLLRLGIAYRRTDPTDISGRDANTWTALRDGFFSGFGP